MSESKAQSDELRAAFRELSDGASLGADDALIDEIWAATAGELPQPRVRELLERSVREPEIAEAWRLAGEIRQRTGVVATAAPQARPRRMVLWTGLAAAAVLALVALLLPQWRGDSVPVSEPSFRDGVAEIVSPLDGGVAVPRGSFELTWSGCPEGTIYNLEVSTASLEVLYRKRGLEEPRHLVDPAALAEVDPKTLLLWHVTGYLPDGREVPSRTFLVELE